MCIDREFKLGGRIWVSCRRVEMMFPRVRWKWWRINDSTLATSQLASDSYTLKVKCELLKHELCVEKRKTFFNTIIVICIVLNWR